MTYVSVPLTIRQSAGGGNRPTCCVTRCGPSQTSKGHKPNTNSIQPSDAPAPHLATDALGDIPSARKRQRPSLCKPALFPRGLTIRLALRNIHAYSYLNVELAIVPVG